MATIGLDKLYYAKITEGTDGTETYGTPIQLAKAMKADLSVELVEATLYADDSPAEVVKEFKSGKLSLGVDDIGTTAAEDLTGAKIDDNHVVISGGRRRSRCYRVPRKEIQREIPLLLALPRRIRYPGDQPSDQG
jgi:phi13 family phage major tail protein